jgi:hypothetical protein
MHIGRDAFVLLRLARLAPFRIIFQTLIREEQLLPGAKDKLLAAIYAPQNSVLVFLHCGILPCPTRMACHSKEVT